MEILWVRKFHQGEKSKDNLSVQVPRISCLHRATFSLTFWVPSSSPIAICLKDNSMTFHVKFVTKSRSDKRYQRLKIPLVSEDKNVWASKELVIHDRCWMKCHTWGFRRQLSWENLKNYITPTHTTETCRRDKFKRQQTTDIKGKPFIPSIWGHPLS